LTRNFAKKRTEGSATPSKHPSSDRVAKTGAGARKMRQAPRAFGIRFLTVTSQVRNGSLLDNPIDRARVRSLATRYRIRSLGVEQAFVM
jgi:hypothetical protein